jgi:hypothetical protein
MDRRQGRGKGPADWGFGLGKWKGNMIGNMMVGHRVGDKGQEGGVQEKGQVTGGYIRGKGDRGHKGGQEKGARGQEGMPQEIG